MPRMNRIAIGNTIYHVINRANGRATIFKTDKEYTHFESLLEEAKELLDMRIPTLTNFVKNRSVCAGCMNTLSRKK